MKNTVRVERAIMDITQQQLADAIGVSRNTINSIESGRYVPSTVLALKIARYFGKPPTPSSPWTKRTDWHLRAEIFPLLEMWSNVTIFTSSNRNATE